MRSAGRVALCTVVAAVVASVGLQAGLKIRVAYDKAHDFSAMKTVAWHPDGAGKVLVLQTVGPDPKELLARFDPIFKSALAAEFTKRGLKLVTDQPADLLVQYYVLIGPNTEAQFRGQFIGGIPPWGLPDFEMTTTSLKIYEQGTIVLDLVDARQKVTCWRGIAETEIQVQRTLAEREKRIRAGVADLLKKFPPKPEKK